MGDSNHRVKWETVLNPAVSDKLLVMVLEYEKNSSNPNHNIISALYGNKNLLYIAKIIIETLYREML